MDAPTHIPVLQAEWLTLCPVSSHSFLLDVTVGHGGHAQAFLDASGGTGRVVGLDADPAAIAAARTRLVPYGDRVNLTAANMAQLKDSVTGGGILHPSADTVGSGGLQEFTHVLFDLGIGSHQLADQARGFSFQTGEGLSMRYGVQEYLPPAQLDALNVLEKRLGTYPDVREVLRGLSAADLADVLYHYGEERYSRRIAAALKEASVQPAPLSAQGLATTIAAAVPAAYARGRIHPATRTFQALRLAVNRELEVLTAALPQAVELLAPEGFLAVISFHSLEDRIVKQFLRANKAKLLVRTKKPVRASPAERASNPHARSAKLRVGQRAPA